MRRIALTAVFCLSLIVLTGCHLLPPAVPNAPRGPSSGRVGTVYEFSAVTTDPNRYPVAYRFDWGNGDLSGWSEFVPGGRPVSMMKRWVEPGTYRVRAQAKNCVGLMSGWSAAHGITITRRPQGYPDEVVATVAVGSRPFSLGILPNGEYVYVCNRSDDVSVVRTSDNTVVATVEIGVGTAFCCAPNNDYVYVTDESHSVHVIRTSDNTVVDQVTVGSHPLGIAASPDGRHVYVGNWSAGTVSVIRTRDNTVIATVPCGMHPWGITVSPDNQWVYTGNGHTNDVTVIRTSDHTRVATVPVAHAPGDNAITPDGAYLFQSCGYSHVGVVNLRMRTVEGYIPFGTYAQGIRFLPSGDYCYVADYCGTSLGIIRTSDRSIVEQLDLGTSSDHIVVHPRGHRVYVTCPGINSIKVIGFGD